MFKPPVLVSDVMLPLRLSIVELVTTQKLRLFTQNAGTDSILPKNELSIQASNKQMVKKWCTFKDSKAKSRCCSQRIPFVF